MFKRRFASFPNPRAKCCEDLEKAMCGLRWLPMLSNQVATAPLTLEDLAAHFKGKGPWKKRLPQLLDTLVALGKARVLEDGRWMG